MATSRQRDKENVVSNENVILINNKEEWIPFICSKMEDLEIIMQSEGDQTQRIKYHQVSLCETSKIKLRRKDSRQVVENGKGDFGDGQKLGKGREEKVSGSKEMESGQDVIYIYMRQFSKMHFDCYVSQMYTDF